jgi:hypothetical protein
MRVTAWATAPAQAMPKAAQPPHIPHGRSGEAEPARDGAAAVGVTRGESSKTRSAMSRIPVLLGLTVQKEYFFSFS